MKVRIVPLFILALLAFGVALAQDTPVAPAEASPEGQATQPNEAIDDAPPTAKNGEGEAQELPATASPLAAYALLGLASLGGGVAVGRRSRHT